MSMALGVAGWVRDPAGRFSWLKTAVLVAVFLPGLMITVQWATVGLGARGLNTAIHLTGTWAVRFLLLSLAVTPGRFLLQYPRIAMLRRLIGVTAACYAGIHLSLFIIDKGGDLPLVVVEITSRFYLMIGFAALLGLAALAVTSTDAWQKRLGRNWKRLHRMTYAIAVLAILHHFLQAKADVSDAVFSTGVFVWMMVWRLEKPEWRSWRAPLLAVTLAATVAAIGIEAAWYGLTTGISGWRVLDANLNVARGLRPGEWVAVAGLLVIAMTFARPLWKPRGASQRRSRNSRPTLTSGLPS